MINLGERIRDGVLFLPGTDEWREWLHHFTPGARRREIAEAQRVIKRYEAQFLAHEIHTIVGLSLGASIAQIIATILARHINVYLIGGKRAPRPYVYPRAQSIRNAGDIVTSLPPWRPRNPNELTRGPWMQFWEAHAWDNYSDLLKRFGAI